MPFYFSFLFLSGFFFLTQGIAEPAVKGLQNHSFHLFEYGPLPQNESEIVPMYKAVDGKPAFAVYRFRAREKSIFSWKIVLKNQSLSHSIPHLILEGPFKNAEEADKVEPGMGAIFRTYPASEEKTVLEATETFEEKGLYRAIVGTAALLEAGQVASISKEWPEIEVFAQCTAVCGTEEKSLSEVVQVIQQSGQVEIFEKTFREKIKKLFPSEKWAAPFLQKFSRAFRSKNEKSFPRLFVLPPPSYWKSARQFVDQISGKERSVISPISGELKELVEGCFFERTVRELSEESSLSSVHFGSLPNDLLPHCILSQSRKLAAVLNALASDNGSLVNVNTPDDTYRAKTPLDLFKALRETGHHLEMRDERRYSDVFSLRVNGANVRIPIWLKTGFSLGREPFTVPLGDAQFAWRIWGPRVNARVSFRFGAQGVGFFAQEEEIPQWAGLRSTFTARSGTEEHDNLILKSLEGAQKIFKRQRSEKRKIPANDYGIFGASADSHALLEGFIERKISVYPLLRTRKENLEDLLKDGLEKKLALLPRDIETTSSQVKDSLVRYDTLCRMMQMVPHYRVEDLSWDLKLRRQIVELFREVGAKCF